MADQRLSTSLILDGITPKAALHLAAEMARSGLIHLYPYEDPERGWTDPLRDNETRAAVRAFLLRLFQAASEASHGRRS